MYADDPQSKLEEITTLPQCDVGCPSSQIFAHEHGLLLAYLHEKAPFGGPDAEPDTFALIRFVRAHAHFFGPPNDEAIEGHPLYVKGLQPYRASG